MNIDSDNQLTGAVIGAAIDVHRQLGPGLDELAYEEALSLCLTARGTANRRQVALPLVYKGVRLDCGYKLDLLVEERLPVELKAVVALLAIHDAQLLTYQRIGRYPLGLLINFHVAVLKEGVKRKAQTQKWTPPVGAPAAVDELKAFDPVSAAVVMAAVEVHRQIGPGLLPSSYQTCLCHELAQRGTSFECNKQLPLNFDGTPLGANAEVPLVAAGEVPVFPIVAEIITPVHQTTAIARLRQGKWTQGLILNFNARTMTEGIKRVVAL